MIDITTFLLLKLIAAIILAITWIWPLMIVVPLAIFILSSYKEKRDINANRMIIAKRVSIVLMSTGQEIASAVGLVILSALFLPSYWGAMWPERKPSVSETHKYPFDSLFHYTFASFAEWKFRREIANPTRIELGTEIRRYRLDGWNPPKHFYVDITDVKTGEKLSGLYVSKHCNVVSALKRGEEYNIMLNRYSYSNQPAVIRYEFTSLYETFCS